MRRPLWVWLATFADAVLLIVAFYMAISAVMVANEAGGGLFPVGVAALFFALPVLCIVATLSAWRATGRRRHNGQIIAVFAAPWVYALFLLLFLFYS